MTRDHSDMMNRLNSLREKFVQSSDGNFQDPSPADYAFLLGMAMALAHRLRDVENLNEEKST